MNQNRTSIESDDAQSDVKLRHGTLSGMQSLGNGVYEISISLGSEFRFVAGEYVWWGLAGAVIANSRFKVVEKRS